MGLAVVVRWVISLQREGVHRYVKFHSLEFNFGDAAIFDELGLENVLKYGSCSILSSVFCYFAAQLLRLFSLTSLSNLVSCSREYQLSGKRTAQINPLFVGGISLPPAHQTKVGNKLVAKEPYVFPKGFIKTKAG